MHAKCSVALVFISVVVVLSGELPRKTKSEGVHVSDVEDSLPTVSKDTKNAPTSSSKKGDLIGDASSLSSHGKPAVLNDPRHLNAGTDRNDIETTHNAKVVTNTPTVPVVSSTPQPSSSINNAEINNTVPTQTDLPLKTFHANSPVNNITTQTPTSRNTSTNAGKAAISEKASSSSDDSVETSHISLPNGVLDSDKNHAVEFESNTSKIEENAKIDQVSSTTSVTERNFETKENNEEIPRKEFSEVNTESSKEKEETSTYTTTLNRTEKYKSINLKSLDAAEEVNEDYVIASISPSDLPNSTDLTSTNNLIEAYSIQDISSTTQYNEISVISSSDYGTNVDFPSSTSSEMSTENTGITYQQTIAPTEQDNSTFSEKDSLDATTEYTEITDEQTITSTDQNESSFSKVYFLGVTTGYTEITDQQTLTSANEDESTFSDEDSPEVTTEYTGITNQQTLTSVNQDSSTFPDEDSPEVTTEYTGITNQQTLTSVNQNSSTFSDEDSPEVTTEYRGITDQQTLTSVNQDSSTFSDEDSPEVTTEYTGITDQQTLTSVNQDSSTLSDKDSPEVTTEYTGITDQPTLTSANEDESTFSDENSPEVTTEYTGITNQQTLTSVNQDSSTFSDEDSPEVTTEYKEITDQQTVTSVNENESTFSDEDSPEVTTEYTGITDQQTLTSVNQDSSTFSDEDSPEVTTEYKEITDQQTVTSVNENESTFSDEDSPEVTTEYTGITDQQTLTSVNQDSSTFSDEDSPEVTTEYTGITDHQTVTSTNQDDSSTTKKMEVSLRDKNISEQTETTEKVDSIYTEVITKSSASTDHQKITLKERAVTDTMTASKDYPTTEIFTRDEASTSTSMRTTTPNIPSICEDDTRIVDFKTKTGKTYIQVKWKLKPDTIDRSCQLRINLSCTSERSFKWVVTDQSTRTEVKSSTPVSFLDNLSEFTNYTCIGQLIKNRDQNVASESFTVTTMKEVPSSVTVKVKKIRSRSFKLEWKRPDKIPGNLKTYYIFVKKTKIHYIRCYNESFQKFIPFSSEKEDLYYTFVRAEPNHQYEVQILAEDEAGSSAGITARFNTKSSPSTEPLNVTSTLRTYTNHCNGSNYNTILHLNWELPCNTNGELVEFKIHVSEIVYLNTNESEYSGNNETYTVPKNSEISDLNYQLVVEKLNASCVYEISVMAVTGGDLQGDPARHRSQRTADGCPSKPSRTMDYSNESSFTLVWNEPEEFHGEILDYTVLIVGGPKHALSGDPSCPIVPQKSLKETTYMRNYTFEDTMPNSFYNYTIQARTSVGHGEASEAGEVLTAPKESEPIRDLEITKIGEVKPNGKYEYKVRITFKEPCNTNGVFLHYMIEEKGTRIGYPEEYTPIKVSTTNYERVLTKPDYQYVFKVIVVTEMFVSKAVTKTISTSAGIPTVNPKKIKYSLEQEAPTIIKIELEKDVFNEDNGAVVQYAIFLFENAVDNLSSQRQSFGEYYGAYPEVNRTTYPSIKASNIYRVTSGLWNPDKNTTTVYIGKKDECNGHDFCKSLSEDTNYMVLLRGFTKNTYRDTFITIKTGIRPSNIHTFIILFLVLLVILLAGLYLYSKRPQLLTIFRRIPDTTVEETKLRHAVAVKHFISYYNKIQNDPTILRTQYEEIDDETRKYKEENVHTAFALKPENKRKNRYTNILPYDEFRVKLNMDEDDEISSDYINASYIKGDSGEIEYIATQGPLEHTCKDFWKMVIQENVTVIVMVSQFVEKEKAKCYKYFPKNHENMMICEDLEVKCLTELQFDTYCVRTLLIKKDIKQYSVIHMQYLEWPDFGCPSGTYNMLSFCEEVRDRIQIEKGLMVVHCSAGVGRTGTLISLDILLQRMRREKEISVFECVIDLRKQRTHMVQTEKQYVYIHTCLKDVLENFSLYSFDDTKKNEEHTYQNLRNEDIHVGRSLNYDEKESAF